MAFGLGCVIQFPASTDLFERQIYSSGLLLLQVWTSFLFKTCNKLKYVV